MRLSIETGKYNDDAEVVALSTSLLYAIIDGDLDEVGTLLDRGADIHVQIAESERNEGQHGYGVFHFIAGAWDSDKLVEDNKEQQMVTLLCKHGANLDAVDDLGQTALHVCADEYKSDMLRIFLEHGANANAADNMKNTPLHIAVCPESSPFEDAMESLIPSISCLLEHGANPILVNAEGRAAADVSFYDCPYHEDMGCDELKVYLADAVENYTRKQEMATNEEDKDGSPVEAKKRRL